jgi:hypothetical protein
MNFLTTSNYFQHAVSSYVLGKNIILRNFFKQPLNRFQVLTAASMKMEAASTSETSVNFYQTARRNIPEDSHLQPLYKYEFHLKDKYWINTLKVQSTTRTFS